MATSCPYNIRIDWKKETRKDSLIFDYVMCVPLVIHIVARSDILRGWMVFEIGSKAVYCLSGTADHKIDFNPTEESRVHNVMYLSISVVYELIIATARTCSKSDVSYSKLEPSCPSCIPEPVFERS